MTTLPLYLELQRTSEESTADHSPRGRGRPATYPPAIPDIEYLAHFRGMQLACCNRHVMLEDLDLWFTQSVAPASSTIYVALSCSCAQLPVVNQSCMHITLGSWELWEGTIDSACLLRTLNATLLRFTYGATRMETRLLPYGRHGYNWSIDPAHWSHFACVCLHQDIVAACGPAAYHPEFHITWHTL